MDGIGSCFLNNVNLGLEGSLFWRQSKNGQRFDSQAPSHGVWSFPVLNIALKMPLPLTPRKRELLSTELISTHSREKLVLCRNNSLQQLWKLMHVRNNNQSWRQNAQLKKKHQKCVTAVFPAIKHTIVFLMALAVDWVITLTFYNVSTSVLRCRSITL